MWTAVAPAGSRGDRNPCAKLQLPAISQIRSLDNREQLGINEVLLSNSLAAYRRSALMDVGGFPKNVIFSEDIVTAARMLLVRATRWLMLLTHAPYHSQPDTWMREFKRYFDIGVLHSRERWLLEEFGHAGGKGKCFVRSELLYLWQNDVKQISAALMHKLGKLPRTG